MDTKKHLKVFVDAYLLNKESQGTTTYIKELYKEASLKNPEIDFYMGCFENETIKKEFKKFQNVKFINFKSHSRVYRMVFEIPKLIKKHQFDFAHFQYVIPLFRDKNCNYITTIHDILFNDFPDFFSRTYRFKRNFLFEWSAKKTDYLLTVSDFSKQSILSRYHLKNKEIVITPNGVSNEFFKPYDKKEARLNIENKYGFGEFILYVSRVEPRKNQELLVRSYLNEKLEESSTHLVFIGANSIINKEFEELMTNLNEGQKEKVHYFESVSDSDFMNFYRAAKWFVYPSKAEGFGIPPIEAGVLKVPVLCSNATAMSSFDFFKPYFCNPNDNEKFQNLFKEFINNYDSIDLEKIKDNIQKKYSWQKSAMVLTNIFNQKI